MGVKKILLILFLPVFALIAEAINLNGTDLSAISRSLEYDSKANIPEIPGIYDIEGDVITISDYYEEKQEWYIRFKNDKFKVTLDLVCPEGKFAGNYTIADAYNRGCFVTDLIKDKDHTFTEMDVNVTLPEGVTDPSVGCEITGTAKDYNGSVYTFHMLKHPPIKPKKSLNIEVDVEVAKWPSESGDRSYYKLKEKGSPENLWTLSFYQLLGEATELVGMDTTAICRMNVETGVRTSINNGIATQTFDIQTFTVTTTASLVMSDSVQYNFAFSVPIENNGEESLSFSDLVLDTSYAEYGFQSISASNDSVCMRVSLMDFSEVPGTYQNEDCQISIDFYHGGEYTTVNSLALISASTELDKNGTPVFRGQFLASNYKMYTVEANYVKPEITDTLYITKDDVEFCDNTGLSNDFYISSMSEYDIIWIRIISDHVEGHFTSDDLDANSNFAYLTESGMMRAFLLLDADFSVRREGRNIVLGGTCQVGNHLVYLDMKVELDDDQLDIDVAKANVESHKTVKSLRRGEIIIMKSGAEYKLTGVKRQ